MKIERIEEYALTKTQELAIARLFSTTFEGYPDGAIYYNQVPDFRFLVYTDDKELVGQAGIVHRIISIAGSPFEVFGLTDLCVAPETQLKNVGSRLLKEISDLASRHTVDFLVLTSEVNEFYVKNGFRTVFNDCRWLVIHHHESMGVFRRTLKEGLMIKETGDAEWPEGEVDFMGHMF